MLVSSYAGPRLGVVPGGPDGAETMAAVVVVVQRIRSSC